MTLLLWACIIYYMKTITVDFATISFYVDTAHGSDVEFVIRDAGVRNKGDEHYYFETLTDIIDQQLEQFANASMDEMCWYGSLLVTVKFGDDRDFAKIKTACAQAVDEWTRKYRINKMKKHD